MDGATWAGILLPGVTTPRDDLNVTLQPSATLAGRVTDASGQPIPRVWVFAAPSYEVERPAFGPAPRQRSDVEGRFELTDVTPGPIRVRVTAEGRRDFEERLELAPGQKLLDYKIVLTVGAALVGQVRDADGEPVVDAQISSMSRSGESYTPVYTDGEGRYRIQGLPTGPREVRVSTSGGQHTSGKVTIEPGENVLDLVFEERAVTLSGHVAGPEGEPLPGVRLQLFEQKGISSTGISQGFYWQPRSLVTSRADGTFVFEQVTEGRYRIQALGPGFASSDTGEELEVRTAPISGLLVRVAPGAVLRGQIRGVRPEELSRLQLTAISLSGSSSLEGEVSPDGSYHFTDIGPGDWYVSAHLLSQNRRVQEKITLVEGQSEAVLDLEFSSGFTLTGQLVARGEPRGGLRIRLRPLTHFGNQSGATYFPQHSNVTTDPGGRFRFDGLESGQYQLLVEISGTVQPLDEIDLGSDQDLLLELPLGRLTVGVTNSSGQGLVGARLQVERLDGDSPGVGRLPQPQSSWPRAGQPQTNTEGAFVLDGLAAGRYRITAHKEGYGSAWREVDTLSGNLDLVLQPTPGLELEVVDAAANPSNHVIASFIDASGQGVFGGFYVIDADGLTRIRNAPLGGWELLVKGAGGATRVRLEVPAAGPVHVALPLSGILRLTAAEQARGDARAILTLRDARGRSYQEPSIDGRIVESWPTFGRPVFDQALPAGVWTVRITVGEHTWEKVVEVVSGAVTEVVWE